MMRGPSAGIATTRILGALLLPVLLMPCAPAAEPVAREPNAMQMRRYRDRSLVSAGDPARLQRAFAKARRGEPVTLGVIGGSITAGATATSEPNRYANRLAEWWRSRFPQCELTLVNAGIGATSSDYGALRARRDLLSRHPDVVVIEFALNDTSIPSPAQPLEGLVRQTLAEPQRPAVLLLFMMGRNGMSVQELHEQVGRHYRLPMVSYLDALWPELDTGRMPAETVFADEVHPNDLGHQIVADLLVHSLDGALRAFPPGARPLSVPSLPAPLYTDLFARVRLFSGADLKPIRADGWSLESGRAFWVSDKPGSVLEVEVEGSRISVHAFKIKGLMGRARVQVDDLEPVTLEGWFSATWGGAYTMDIVARDLTPGKHRVRIEVLPDRAPESTGHEFRIFAVGGIGIR